MRPFMAPSMARQAGKIRRQICAAFQVCERLVFPRRRTRTQGGYFVPADFVQMLERNLLMRRKATPAEMAEGLRLLYEKPKEQAAERQGI